jgi:hypothetical protein
MAKTAEKPKNLFTSMGKRLAKAQAKAPAYKPRGLNIDSKIQTPKSSDIDTKTVDPHTVSEPLKFDSVIQMPPLRIPSRQSALYSDRIALTAQQFADEAAKAHASKAGWLVDRVIGDMTAVLDRVSESIPFADVREIKPLTETHQIASAEIRRALGLRDDIDASGSRSLVQIQCVGTVSVTEPVQPMSIDLPDVDFE